ncbi:hypothetical protein B296_00032233 [Ensete ventricosum]|uniref:IST1-like protein n=1 Tax=Ensete ventricosum TaxID=4639 RepID=A0A426YRD6_ENSVE|nr:hypothetical protein B296_00032233 [Ensete ventricosum]
MVRRLPSSSFVDSSRFFFARSGDLFRLVVCRFSSFGLGFSVSSFSKTEAKMATARIKLLRNKREAQVRQMRRDVAMLLESGRDETARIRVRTLRSHPPYSFLLLLVLRSGLWDRILRVPYGSEIWGFASLLIEKLSVRKPTGEIKLKVLKEIAKEYRVKWDAAESEQELLKPPEEVLVRCKVCVCVCVHAHVRLRCCTCTCLRVHSELTKLYEYLFLIYRKDHAPSLVAQASLLNLHCRYMIYNQMNLISGLSFNCSNNMDDESMDTVTLDEKRILRRNSCTARTAHSAIKFDDSDGLVSDTDEEFEMESPPLESHPPPSRPPPVLRMQQQVHSEESYADSHQESSNKNSGSHVHPKLPDYEALTARFEALKSRRI